MIIYVLIFSVVVVLIGFYFLYSVKNQNIARREERQEHLKQRQERLLETLRHQSNKDQNDEVSPRLKSG
jgi:Tfp pilus assembly protein PilO